MPGEEGALRPRARLFSFSLLARRRPGRAGEDRTRTQEDREALGFPGLPLPGTDRPGPEPPRLPPGRTGCWTPQDYNGAEDTPPHTHPHTMWGLLIWTLLALHGIPQARAQGRRATPTWGGEGVRGRGRSLLASRRRPPGHPASPGQNSLKGVSGPSPSLGALEGGGWAVFLRLVASE